jgi:glycolate oxidase iron-sulfur subunit
LDQNVIEHLDSCLGCMACESACPSGVRYGSRIEEFRSVIAREDTRLFRRARAFVAHAAANPQSLRIIRRMASTFDRLGLEGFRRRLGGLGLVPRRSDDPAAMVVPAPEAPKIRVALLVGCVTSQLRPGITSSSVNALRRNGVDVVVIAGDTCCGALDLHGGHPDAARRSALSTSAAAIGRHVDYIVTTAAGCGAMLRRYIDLFGGDDARTVATSWVARNARDICEVLVEVGLRPPRRKRPDERAIAYHDACHLLHGCGVDRAPRDVLSAAGIRWFELGENAICCGGAGVYNLLHPRTARDLERRKVELLVQSTASDLAVGNIGCIMQFERALSRAGRTDIGVWHPVELLEAAYREEESE